MRAWPTGRMTRYADPTLCPDCRASLPPAPTSCPRCALPLQGPDAAALLRLLSEADARLAALRATAPAAARGTDRPDALPQPPPRRGVRGPSVPRILLGLGALCLLVAAVTFLAVAWTWLGVGGRTGVLLALTVASAAGGLRLAGRGLRVGAESFTTVALGLLALDVVGAERAGWLGDLSDEGLALAVGAGVLVGGAALALAGRAQASGPDGARDRVRLTTPQLLAGAGLALATLGWIDVAPVPEPVSVSAAVLAAAGLAALAARADLPVLRTTGLAVASLWWLLLVASALVLGADRASLVTWWGDGHAPALLEAAGWAALVLVLRPARRGVRTAALATSTTLLTVVALVPVVDESTTVAVLACLAAVLVWTAAVRLAPRWRAGLAAPQLLAALPTLPPAVGIVAAALANVLGAGPASTRPAGVVLAGTETALGPLMLAPVVLVLALAAAAHRDRDRSGAVLVAGAGALAALVTLAAGAVPLWTVVAAVAATGAAAVLLGCTARATAPPRRAGAALGVLLLLGASGAALPSAVLTTAALGVLVASSALLTLLAGEDTVAAAASAVLPAAAGALVWSACGVLDVGADLRALPVLLVAGALALARPRPVTELPAAVVGALATLVALAAAGAGTLSTLLAVHLTLAGVLATASALLHPHRRGVGWVGGLLLAAATWVRLADLGVSAPEAYTLPSALALLALGLARLRRDPAASTRTSLLAGLVLALVPTLLWVLATDPLSVRAVLLGGACLLLVLGGAARRWSAPLVVGGVVGGVLVLAELAPYAGRSPSWLLLALAGALLSVVGVTWEARMGDVRRAAGYLARLR